MRKTLLTIALGLLVAACGNKENGEEQPAPDQAAPEQPQAQGGGHQMGPNGGPLVVLGSNEGHLEILANHKEGTVWVFTYDREMEELPVDAAPVMNFMSADGPKQLTGDGEEAEWLFMDESLKKEFKQLRFRLVVGGKTYTPVWDHVH